MATNDTTTTSAGPSAKKTTAKRATSAKRAPNAARARRAPAASTSTRPATGVARAQRLAERAVLIPLGAALETRDRVTAAVDEIVSTTRSRTALDRRLKRLEQRGGAVRHSLPSIGAGAFTGRVENVVQNGVSAGITLVNGVGDRLGRLI